MSRADTVSGLLADPALGAVLAVLPEARVVGGAVRDALDGRAVSDIDLATSRRPEAVMAALQAAGIRAIPTGIEHGTVTALVDGRPFEITTLRRDEETDGRHARVAYTDDWQEDAARRDFTINAMSLTPGGELFDYFGGRSDLATGRVRFVGDPARRIAEDYLRILRFFRFHARYGRGEPHALAASAIRAGVPGMSRLSPERIWSELKRILAVADPVSAVALMDELAVLPAVLPGRADVGRLARLVDVGAPADPLLRFAALVAGDSNAVAERFRLSGTERDRLIAIHGGKPPQPGASAADLRRALADTPADILIDRTWLAGGAGPDWAELRARIGGTARPMFPLEGRDALALGIPPGPRVGELLRAVRQWWFDGGCEADAAACRAELAHRIGG